MSAFPNAVSIQVGSDAHAVAVGTSVEWWGVEADCASINSISIASADVGDLPDEYSVSGFHIEDVLLKADFINGNGVASQAVLHGLEQLNLLLH